MRCDGDDCATTPVTVVGLDTPMQLDVGMQHACVVLVSRRVACWGSNASGELGDGTLTLRAAPVFVLAP